MKKYLRTLPFIIFCLIQINAQKADLKPFSIKPSSLISELKILKTTYPKISSDDFVKAANLILDKQGIDFIVGLDANTCKKIEDIKKAQKDKNTPLNLRATLKSPLGEPASLALPEANFTKNECFSCFITLPFVEATDNEFVTIVAGINLKFFLPSNFLLNEVSLVDEKNTAIVKKKWKIPFRTAPISISDDGDMIFLGFEESELSDLVLISYDTGSYQIYAKKDVDVTKKSSIVKDVVPNGANFSYLQFALPSSNQLIKFPTKCSN
jgi:hypothetical protein